MNKKIKDLKEELRLKETTLEEINNFLGSLQNSINQNVPSSSEINYRANLEQTMRDLRILRIRLSLGALPSLKFHQKTVEIIEINAPCIKPAFSMTDDLLIKVNLCEKFHQHLVERAQSIFSSEKMKKKLSRKIKKRYLIRVESEPQVDLFAAFKIEDKVYAIGENLLEQKPFSDNFNWVDVSELSEGEIEEIAKLTNEGMYQDVKLAKAAFESI